MRAICQVCKKAYVEIDNKMNGKCDKGLMVLVGFTEGDNEEIIEKMVSKILKLRIFPDENDVMNLSVLDVGGSILSISQFTLYADTKKGNRPSYINALKGEESSKLYDIFNKELEKYIHVETGIFGSHMEVTFTNVGPTTIMLEL